MVHEKYITRNGKKYGPYYYESYREDGKVKKRYVQLPDLPGKRPDRELKFIVLISGLLLVGLLWMFSSFESNYRLLSPDPPSIKILDEYNSDEEAGVYINDYIIMLIGGLVLVLIIFYVRVNMGKKRRREMIKKRVGVQGKKRRREMIKKRVGVQGKKRKKSR
jgi:hypothetical protein